MAFLRSTETALVAAVIGLSTIPFLDDDKPVALVLQSIPLMLYLSVMAILLVTLAFRLLRWQWLLCIVAVFGLAAVSWTVPQDKPIAASTLRVATWNTEYWDQKEGTAKFSAVVNALDADVLLLQEHLYWDQQTNSVVAIDQASLLRSCCGYQYVWQKGELVTASRQPGIEAPITSNNALQVEIAGVTFLNTHVPVHITRLHTPFETEFWTFVRHAARDRKTTFQAVEAELSDVSKRVILGGDFNATFLMPQMRMVAWKAHFWLWPLTFPHKGPSLWKLDHLGDSANQLTECATTPIPSAASDHTPLVCKMLIVQ